MKSRYFLLATALFLVGCDERHSDIGWYDALKAWITGEVPQKYLMDDLAATQSDLPVETQAETPTGNYLAGRFAQSNFDWPTANLYFSRVLNSQPDNLELQKRSMVLAMGSGDYDRAIDQARKVSKQGEPGSLPRLFLALASLKSGDYAVVLRDVENIPEDGISEFVKPLLRAWAAAGVGTSRLDGLNRNVVHYFHAVLIADYLKDQAALKSLSQRDYSRMGLAPKSLEQIASIFRRNGMTARGDEIASSIDKTDEDMLDKPAAPAVTTPVKGMARALFDMASVLYQEYPDSAQLFARMSLYLDPEEIDSRILVAHMATQFKRYNEAIVILGGIDTTSNPVLGNRIRQQIAELMVKTGRDKDAIRILRSLVTDTKDVDAQIQIGDIFRESEKLEPALQEYDKAFLMLDGKIAPKYWRLFYSRGIVHERLKQWSAAEKDLKSALLLEPNQPYVLNYLGYSWTDQGKNLNQATRMIEKAARLRPGDGYIVDSLGWIYYRREKFPLAVEALERAVELLPADPTINDHLGDAYWRTGRRAEARFQWNRALSLDPTEDQKAMIEGKIDTGLTATGDDASKPPADKDASQNGQ